MRPKWDKVTVVDKADKVCCSCFRAQTRAQGCVPLSHTDILIRNEPEGAQRIIAAYTDKKKLWEDSKKNPPPPKNIPRSKKLFFINFNFA